MTVIEWYTPLDTIATQAFIINRVFYIELNWWDYDEEARDRFRIIYPIHPDQARHLYADIWAFRNLGPYIWLAMPTHEDLEQEHYGF